MSDKFQWGNIWQIGAFGLIVLVLLVMIWGVRYRKVKLRSLVSLSLIPSLVSGAGNEDLRIWKNTLLVLVLFFGVIALMDPQYNYTWDTIRRTGTDIIIALDTSKSMYARDVPPSRFERSILEIKNLIDHIDGDRVGLIVFTSNARVQCPLTLDYGAFKLFLDEVEIGLLPRGGTSTSAAIEQAVSAFDLKYKKERILILVTDGETHDSRIDDAIQKAKNANIKIFSIGLGSKEGVPILLPAGNGEKVYVKDENGNTVLSKLQDEDLKKMALETGGAYVQAEVSGFNLEAMYREKIAPLLGRELESKRKKRYEHRFYIPLGIALFFLLLEMLLPERKKLQVS
ncbi:MAG: VWA domain-containing protein [Candidatus Aureabacteria bacterium]|nr:VWA domain-containing protein [Candidatus Auribacterota bacterium]